MSLSVCNFTVVSYVMIVVGPCITQFPLWPLCHHLPLINALYLLLILHTRISLFSHPSLRSLVESMGEGSGGVGDGPTPPHSPTPPNPGTRSAYVQSDRWERQRQRSHRQRRWFLVETIKPTNLYLAPVIPFITN